MTDEERAAFAFNTIVQAGYKGDVAEIVVEVKAWLTQIGSGDLVVISKPDDTKSPLTEVPNDGKAKGSKDTN